MKKLIIIISLIFWGIIGAGETSARHGVSGYFYNGLSPYGSWIEIDYGVVVWRPTVMNVEWSPYRDGRWIWTSDGWYWHSYEPFGHITYHYGRWYFDDYYGWLWYPDYDWAPAWVEWRYDDDYIGWAPLHPYAIFTIGVGIHFSTSYYTPYYHWHFVNYNHFYDPYVYNHCLGPKYKYRVYSNTRYRTNYFYHDGRIRNRGVDIDVVRKRSSHDIRRRDLQRDADLLSLDNGKVRDEGKIRTFYRSRDELVKNEVRDVKYERSERKSSLDVTRLDRRDLKERNRNISTDKVRVKQNRTQEKRNEKVTREKKNTTTQKREVKTFERRKKSGNDIRRNTTKKNRTNGNLNRKIEKKKDVRKKTTINNNRVNRNNNNKKKEVKINRNNKQKQEVKTFRNNKQKKQIKVKRNTQNKNTVKTKRNTNNNNRTKVNKNTGGNNRKRKR